MHFLASIPKITAIYETAKHLKKKIFSGRKDKTPDNAVAYRGFLTHYAAKISLFKEIHPYLVWALPYGVLVLTI